jgi:hypothetical protein
VREKAKVHSLTLAATRSEKRRDRMAVV